MRDWLDELYREEARPVLATLIRLLGDFDLAEDALNDAFAAALKQWPVEGVPDQPRAWLISTGRFRAIDQLRQRARHQTHLEAVADQLAEEAVTTGPDATPAIEDDLLRLIFTCCHPQLPIEARLALTLREVCGLTTEQIAHAFLTRPGTLAQRIVRAKQRIRDAGIPYEVPEGRELPDRLDAVLHVVYLMFNEGYSPTDGDRVTRPGLAEEAIRLGRLLCRLLPEPEASGLLALMLLHDARASSRTTAGGDLVRLADQDRTLWDQGRIEEGVALVEQALTQGPPGPYGLQAAIAAVHAQAPSAEDTDWHEIVGLYEVLFQHQPTPIVALNRAAAIAMRDGPEAGLAAVDALLDEGELAHYHLAHAARADFCRQLGRRGEARQAYRQALELTQQGPEQRFLQQRLATLNED